MKNADDNSMDDSARKPGSPPSLAELLARTSSTPCPYCGPATTFHEKGVTDCRVNGESMAQRSRREIQERAARKEPQ